MIIKADIDASTWQGRPRSWSGTFLHFQVGNGGHNTATR